MQVARQYATASRLAVRALTDLAWCSGCCCCCWLFLCLHECMDTLAWTCMHVVLLLTMWQL
jgi:hypothetical protein